MSHLRKMEKERFMRKQILIGGVGVARYIGENSKQPPQLLTNRKTTVSFQIAQIAALMIRFSRVNEFPDNGTRYQGI
jgi:hypothetical protein